MSTGRRPLTGKMHNRVRFALLALSLIAVMAVAASCGGYGTSSTPSNSSQPAATSSDTSASVSLKNLSFSPNDLTVKQGAKVTWSNNDNTTHTITSDSGMFDSGNESPGNSFDFTFASPGSYSYHCKIHSNMQGTITVK